MRRLAQHAIAGIGFSALVVTAAVAGLGSPAGEGSAIAVPAPVTSVAFEPVSETGPELAAERAARDQRITRAAQRAQLAAAKQAAKQAAQRAATLGKQGQSIEDQQAKLKAEKAAVAKARAEADAKAKAEAAAAKEAQARVLANRGYEPGTTDPKEIAKQIGVSPSTFERDGRPPPRTTAQVGYEDRHRIREGQLDISKPAFHQIEVCLALGKDGVGPRRF